MNPAERYAALKLLAEALKPAIDEAREAAETYRDTVGAKTLETPYGDVSITRRKPTIAITDEAAMVAWCDETMPHLVHRSISRESETWLTTKRLEVDGGDVIDPATGEAIAWAMVKPGSEYLTVRLTAAAKAEAADAVAGRLDAVTALALTGGAES